MYIYKDKTLKLNSLPVTFTEEIIEVEHEGEMIEKVIRINHQEIPEGWTEITLEAWEDVKATWDFSSEESENANRLELTKIELWLNSTEWIPIKVTLGEWEETDTRYTDYLDERLIKRNRHAELQGLLGLI